MAGGLCHSNKRVNLHINQVVKVVTCISKPYNGIDAHVLILNDKVSRIFAVKYCWSQRLQAETKKRVMTLWKTWKLTWWRPTPICGRFTTTLIIFQMEWKCCHWTRTAAGSSSMAHKCIRWYQWQTLVHALQLGNALLTGDSVISV